MVWLYTLIQLNGKSGLVQRDALKRTTSVSLLAIVFIAWCDVSIAASVTKCGGGLDQNLIDKREGSNQFGGVEFGFESRVENYNRTARRYAWCIENFSQYLIADFRWGNDADLNKDFRYFGAIVEPGKVGYVVRTDSSDVQRSSRFIGFRRLNSNFWTTISAETIFNSRIGELEVSDQQPATSSIKKVQFKNDADDSLVDIIKLSHDSKSFAELVREKKLVFQDSIVATIPTNSNAVVAVGSGKYEKYDPNDFVRVTIRLANFFTLDDGAVFSNVILSVWPENKEDNYRLKDALKNIDGLITLRPTASQPFPKELLLEDRAEIGERRILRQRATELSYLPATLTIRSKQSEVNFATLPITILVSTN